jgi:integration host factor subunit alpha
MTLTKEQLIDSIYPIIENRAKAVRVVETLFETTKRTLEHGEDVLVSGFGKFHVRDKRKRRGRNPLTGEALFLDARRVLIFKSSGLLNKKINNNAYD